MPPRLKKVEEMTTPVLEIRNLHARIEEREILKGVNLIIPPGEVHNNGAVEAEVRAKVKTLTDRFPIYG